MLLNYIKMTCLCSLYTSLNSMTSVITHIQYVTTFAWPFNDNTAHKEWIFLTASFGFLGAWTNLLLEFILLLPFSSPAAVLASG